MAQACQTKDPRAHAEIVSIRDRTTGGARWPVGPAFAPERATEAAYMAQSGPPGQIWTREGASNALRAISLAWQAPAAFVYLPRLAGTDPVAPGLGSALPGPAMAAFIRTTHAAAHQRLGTPANCSPVSVVRISACLDSGA